MVYGCRMSVENPKENSECLEIWQRCCFGVRSHRHHRARARRSIRSNQKSFRCLYLFAARCCIFGAQNALLLLRSFFIQQNQIGVQFCSLFSKLIELVNESEWERSFVCVFIETINKRKRNKFFFITSKQFFPIASNSGRRISKPHSIFFFFWFGFNMYM